MALLDDVRANRNPDTALDERIVKAQNPAHTGRIPRLTASWDDVFDWLDAIPNVRYRMGHDRLGPSRRGEMIGFYFTITTNSGANRFKEITVSTRERRMALEAAVVALGLV